MPPRPNSLSPIDGAISLRVDRRPPRVIGKAQSEHLLLLLGACGKECLQIMLERAIGAARVPMRM